MLSIDITAIGLKKRHIGFSSQLQLNLARDVKRSKKRFYMQMNSKRKTQENVGLLMNAAEELEINDMKRSRYSVPS